MCICMTFGLHAAALCMKDVWLLTDEMNLPSVSQTIREISCWLTETSSRAHHALRNKRRRRNWMWSLFPCIYSDSCGHLIIIFVGMLYPYLWFSRCYSLLWMLISLSDSFCPVDRFFLLYALIHTEQVLRLSVVFELWCFYACLLNLSGIIGVHSSYKETQMNEVKLLGRTKRGASPQLSVRKRKTRNGQDQIGTGSGIKPVSGASRTEASVQGVHGSVTPTRVLGPLLALVSLPHVESGTLTRGRLTDTNTGLLSHPVMVLICTFPVIQYILCSLPDLFCTAGIILVSLWPPALCR